MLLLEKSFAKLCGSYEQLKLGLASDALMDLTGCPCERIELDRETAKSRPSDVELWEMLTEWDQQGYVGTEWPRCVVWSGTNRDTW